MSDSSRLPDQSPGTRRFASIASDEDCTIGFLLADDHAPATHEERLVLFVDLAEEHWGITYDPAKVGCATTDPRPYTWTEGDEAAHPTTEGEEPTDHWYVFTDLEDAER